MYQYWVTLFSQIFIPELHLRQKSILFWTFWATMTPISLARNMISIGVNLCWTPSFARIIWIYWTSIIGFAIPSERKYTWLIWAWSTFGQTYISCKKVNKGSRIWNEQDKCDKILDISYLYHLFLLDSSQVIHWKSIQCHQWVDNSLEVHSIYIYEGNGKTFWKKPVFKVKLSMYKFLTYPSNTVFHNSKIFSLEICHQL